MARQSRARNHRSAYVELSVRTLSALALSCRITLPIRGMPKHWEVGVLLHISTAEAAPTRYALLLAYIRGGRTVIKRYSYSFSPSLLHTTTRITLWTSLFGESTKIEYCGCKKIPSSLSNVKANSCTRALSLDLEYKLIDDVGSESV